MQTTNETAPRTAAVVIPQRGQMSLLGFLDEKLNGVFTPKELKDKDGKVNGSAIVMRTRKEMAELNDLKGKENKEKLDALIEAKGVEAFQKALAELVGLEGGSFRLIAGRNVTSKDGLRSITLRAKEVNTKKGPTDEQIAKALGMTVEEVAAMRERQQKALAEKTIDVQ